MHDQLVEPNTRKDKEVADQWLHGTQDFGPRDRNIAPAYRTSSSGARTRGEGGVGWLALASEASEEYLGGVSAGRGSSLSADRN